jgi:hypothetical protein
MSESPETEQEPTVRERSEALARAAAKKAKKARKTKTKKLQHRAAWAGIVAALAAIIGLIFIVLSGQLDNAGAWVASHGPWAPQTASPMPSTTPTPVASAAPNPMLRPPTRAEFVLGDFTTTERRQALDLAVTRNNLPGEHIWVVVLAPGSKTYFPMGDITVGSDTAGGTGIGAADVTLGSEGDTGDFDVIAVLVGDIDDAKFRTANAREFGLDELSKGWRELDRITVTLIKAS